MIRAFLLLTVCLLTFCGGNSVVAQEQSTSSGITSQALANAFARLIENALPREYEKRKDWGNTKDITTGLRADGLKIHRRKKPVKHGVWKHYKIRLVEPEEKLSLRIQNLRSLEDGRFAFTVMLQAKFDLWARAKIYRYGIHLIALEALGDAAIDLAIDCEVGWQLGPTSVGLHPRVTAAQLDITDFNLRRVSNAKGPIIRELGEELPRILAKELQGPKLVAKLNRAIDKKRDRLELRFGELLTGK